MDAVQQYVQGEKPSLLIKSLGCSDTALNNWVKMFKQHGIKGLGPSTKQRYDVDFRRKVTEAYRSGAGSSFDIALAFGIPSNRTVCSWINHYNGHEENCSPGGGVPMTKGRRTTIEERIEIVEYCIKHKLDYIRTAELFQVSYNQVYAWVKKYNQQGSAALSDKRGKRKALEDMSELERLRAENKQLQMENGLLKKLAELERRGGWGGK